MGVGPKSNPEKQLSRSQWPFWGYSWGLVRQAILKSNFLGGSGLLGVGWGGAKINLNFLDPSGLTRARSVFIPIFTIEPNMLFTDSASERVCFKGTDYGWPGDKTDYGLCLGRGGFRTAPERRLRFKKCKKCKKPW